MTTTIKEFDRLVFKKNQQVAKRRVIKVRLANAALVLHRETCKNCKSEFEQYMEAKAFHDAGKETENLMSNLLSKSLH